MKNILCLTLTEKDGEKLKEIISGMDVENNLYGFIEECIRKFDYKIGLKPKIYNPEEMPKTCKAAIKIEYDENLKKSLLSEDSKKLFGDNIYEQFAYRLAGILPR